MTHLFNIENSKELRLKFSRNLRCNFRLGGSSATSSAATSALAESCHVHGSFRLGGIAV